MSSLDPRQQATRERVESLISLAAPVLNVMLAVGERVSRIAEPTDHEYYPIRAESERMLEGEALEDPARRGS